MNSGTLIKTSLAQDEGNKGNPSQSIKPIVSEEELQEEIKAFRALFPTIINDVTEGLGELEEARKRITDCFLYNVSHGERMFCLTPVLSYKLIVGKENCSSEKLFLARILSWCVQMWFGFTFMADDIMDRSITRKWKLCWYRKEDVGMTAVNDICFIQNSIFLIIKKYFSSFDCYADILDVFTEVTQECLIGQYLDMQATLPMKKPNLRDFTFEKYAAIVKGKASSLMAFTVALALYLAGFKKELVKHPKLDGLIRRILSWLQVQNDFLDCFGDTAETGKIGNDIEIGKCTWLILTALQKASESQLKILEENYGVDSPNCKEKVVKVYKDLKLDEMYVELGKREYEEVLKEVQDLSNDEQLSFLQPVIINLANQAWAKKYAYE